MDMGHEGGWHGEHEALHQHAWAWAPTQAHIRHHGQAQGSKLHHSPLHLGITLRRSFLSPAWRKARWPLSGEGHEALQGLEARATGEDGGNDDEWLREEMAMRAGDVEGEESKRFIDAAHAAKRKGGRRRLRMMTGVLGDEA